MSTRIEIELTSALDDATWTWRAAGAKLPKGTVAASVLPADSKVGDLLRAEAEMHMDGTEIVSVLPPKAERAEPELLEIVGSGRNEELVTSTLVSKRDRDRDRGKGRGKGRDGDKGRGKGRGRNDRGRGGERGERGERGGDGENKGRDRRPRRPSKPPLPERPKPKRLRAKRDHRTKVLAELPEEHQPIAEQVLRGGVPAVRKAIEEQNAKNKAENLPEVEASGLVKLAEDMLPKLKAAEWEDRADAALAGIEELDLRDLRSVVVAAESAARSDEALAKAEQLRAAVTSRVDNEHAKWLADVDAALKDDRTVRALRMSSRPPKAGAPLPPDLAKRLSDAALAGLTTEISQDRWGTVLDALSYSPVRSNVIPPAIPENPTDELVSTVRRLSMRIPEIAALFGIEPTAAPKRERRRRGGAKKKSDGGGGAAKAGKPKKDKPKTEAPKAEEPKAEAPAEAAAEAPAPAAAAAEAPAEAAAEEE